MSILLVMAIIGLVIFMMPRRNGCCGSARMMQREMRREQKMIEADSIPPQRKDSKDA